MLIAAGLLVVQTGFQYYLDFMLFTAKAIRTALAKSMIATYPVKIGKMLGTTSNKADQSSALTQFKTIRYYIRSVKATKAREPADDQPAMLFFFDRKIQPLT